MMVVRLVPGRFSKAQRAKQRSKIILDDAALSFKTQQRYYNALRLVLPFVESAKNIHQLDDKICSWIRSMWRKGESLVYIADGLCAMHFYEPWTKHKVPRAWKLYGIWRRIEMPSRAPPLTQHLVRAMSAYELDHGNHEMSTILVLAFHCLLRTGEALQLTTSDFALGNKTAVCALKHTKSGKRNAANEAVSITDPIVLESLRSLILLRRQQNTLGCPLWTGSNSSFRKRFKELCNVFDLSSHGFRPYSLRRGGATHLFQTTNSMELALLRGRWESSRVAKIYISDGLSYLPSIRLSSKTSSLLHKFFYFSPQIG